MVQHPYILGSLGDTPNIFDVFLTSTLSAHSFKLFPLFGLLPPQPNFCTLSCLFCTVSRPAGKGMLLASCFSSVGYFFDFQDSSSVCARAKTEVIVSGMEAHTRLYHTDRDLAQSVNPQVSSDFLMNRVALFDNEQKTAKTTKSVNECILKIPSASMSDGRTRI